MFHRHPVGFDHLGGHGFGGKLCPKALQPQVQRGLLAYLAVKQGEFCKQRQQVVFELCWFRYGLRFQRGGKAALVRGHDRGGVSLRQRAACMVYTSWFFAIHSCRESLYWMAKK